MSSIRLTVYDSNARDIGYLLEKHPDREYESKLSDEVTARLTWEHFEWRSEIVFTAEVDPLELARGSLYADSYVNEHPWICGTLFWQAFSKTFRSALGGRTRGDQALLEKRWDVQVQFTACLRDAFDVTRYFGSLGYQTETVQVLGTSIYTITLRPGWGLGGEGLRGKTVQQLFRHLYVLGIALDPRRLHPLDSSAVDKLQREAADWLPEHPHRDEIIARFCGKFAKDVQIARPEEDVEEAQPPEVEETEPAPPTFPKLSDLRREAILNQLKARLPILDPENPPLIVEIGSGNGRLCEEMAAAGYLVLGIDQDLKRCSQALRHVKRNETPRCGFEVMSGLYALVPVVVGNHGRPRFKRENEEKTEIPVACIVCTEVIEHVDPVSLPLFWRVLLSAPLVIVTTPNRDYNPLYGLPEGHLRDRDHRFEWTWRQTCAQAEMWSDMRGYREEISGIGPFALEFVESKCAHDPDAAMDALKIMSVAAEAQPSTMVVFTQRAEAPFQWGPMPYPGRSAAFHVTAGYSKPILIPWEQRTRALTMLNGAVSPTLLPYIPPTMSPCDAALAGDELETIEGALCYYAERGVQSVVIEKKHMGSRAVAYFAPTGERVLYTRTGRPFPKDVAAPILDALYRAMGKPPWALVDGELLPWGAKAQDLIERSFAPCGAALISDSAIRGDLDAKRDGHAFMRQVWHYAASGEPVRFAPFALLHMPHWSHTDHMEEIRMWVARDGSGLLQETFWASCKTDGVSSWARSFYEGMIRDGAEGVVIKPEGGMGVLNAQMDYVQPGIKVRNPEYLRIIYGPRYGAYLNRLRERGTKRKRRVALQQHALGMEALSRLYKNGGVVDVDIHALAFATLALDAEPLDPRL